MPKITAIKPLPKLERRKNVAGYCRVSCGKDSMLQSLSSQVAYYSQLIQSHTDWAYAGVYADEAETGTKENRHEFQRMLTDCRAGKIDMIITKSISRFARNTVTVLESVRELKNLGVDVYFEEQNIHTTDGDGELLLTILASYAQEESKSVSENMLWRIQKNFEEGQPWNKTVLGYRYKGDCFVIVPEEAELVRRIYDLYLSGLGTTAIVKILNEEECRTRFDNEKWHRSVIHGILTNDTYTGNLTLQKTFSEDHISKITRINRGELPKYYAEETHEAIIPMETFQAVQAEMARRAAKAHRNGRTYTPFSGKLICGICGKHYNRRKKARGECWDCITFNDFGKEACPSKRIPESTLMEKTAEILHTDEFSPAAFEHLIAFIRVCPENRLVYHFHDGHEEETTWKDRSRAASWTPEMREAARANAMKRGAKCQK